MADLTFMSLDHLPTRTGLGLMLHSIWSSRLQSSYNLCTASDQMFPPHNVDSNKIKAPIKMFYSPHSRRILTLGHWLDRGAR